MEIIVIELSAGLLLVALIWLARRRRGKAHKRVAAVAQQTWLNGLEKLHERLAALDQRTTAVERKIESLMQGPLLERRQHYEAAALLFAAGHDSSRIAGMLDLPLAQVEMIGELKKILNSDANTNPGVEPPPPARTAKNKAATRAAKPKRRQILLTDIVEPAHALDGAAA